MTAKSAIEIQGLEYDWLACDDAEHVALFSTAGGGFMPEPCLQDTDAQDAAIDAICNLPIVGTPKFAPSIYDERNNIWRQLAERGVFAFDSDYEGSPYKLVASPLTAICLADLPEEVAAIVRKVTLRGMRFSSGSSITKEALTALPM